MSFSEFVSPLVGRFVLAWFFMSQAVAFASTWDATVQLMVLKNIPAAPALLALAILIMGMGAISLALGYQARYGALMLFGFVVAVASVMHNFWDIAKPADRMADYALFSRDIAIAGALLIVVGLGPGGLAIDNRPEKTAAVITSPQGEVTARSH